MSIYDIVKFPFYCMNYEILFEKSDESFNAANLCQKQSMIASSINRLYYSLLQYIKGTLLYSGEDLDKCQGEDSHIKLTGAGLSYIMAKKLLPNAFVFKNDFGLIRDLRVAADYHNRRMNESDYILAKRTYDEIKGYFIYVK